jgi:transposase-like protein
MLFLSVCVAKAKASAREGVMSEENAQLGDQGTRGLLTADERAICGRVATGDAPHSQRALALMALDQGVTQAEAAELSGLSTGQVRYWRDKYREKGLGIFPKDVGAGRGASVQPKTSPEQAVSPLPVASTTVEKSGKAVKSKKRKRQAAEKGKKARSGKGNSARKAKKKAKEKKKADKKDKRGKQKSAPKAEGKGKKKGKGGKKGKDKKKK